MGLGNLINLYRIQKAYSHFRKAVDNPKLLADSKWWLEFFKLLLAITEIKELIHMLQGYKTYIVAALTAAVTLLHALGYIDDATYQALLALLGAGAVTTVAAKINRIQQDVNDKLTKGK